MAYTNDIAVRFNFHRIAPLGIDDADCARIALALGMDSKFVENLCENYRERVADAASVYAGRLPRASRNERICFIGDSLTSDRLSYMRIFKEAFAGDENIEVFDCSISGWKTSDVLFEYENVVTPRKPTIIHMIIGSNDSRNAYPGHDTSTASVSMYRRNMLQLIRYGLDLGAKVVVTTLSPAAPATQPLSNGNIPCWETESFNEVLREIASEQPIILNDIEAELKSRIGEIIDDFDNLHLNANGQRMIAERVIGCLSKVILEQDRKITPHSGEGFSFAARNRSEGVLEVRRATSDEVADEKTSRYLALFSGIALAKGV